MLKKLIIGALTQYFSVIRSTEITCRQLRPVVPTLCFAMYMSRVSMFSITLKKKMFVSSLIVDAIKTTI